MWLGHVKPPETAASSILGTEQTSRQVPRYRIGRDFASILTSRFQPEYMLPIHGRDRIPIQADMRTRGVDVAPETLHRVLQAERRATGGDKDGINCLNQ